MLLQIVLTEDTAVPALAGLSNLQRCYLHLEVPDGDAAPPLPAGPWLANLRWLHYPIDGLVVSTATLQATTTLEFLEAAESEQIIDWRSPAAADFFGWLAQHPPLRRLFFEAERAGL